MNHSNHICKLLSPSKRKVSESNNVRHLREQLSTSGGSSIIEYQRQKESRFKNVQNTLGTILLALNWHGWSHKDRAALLLCIDALERRLIDMKYDSKKLEGK